MSSSMPPPMLPSQRPGSPESIQSDVLPLVTPQPTSDAPSPSPGLERGEPGSLHLTPCTWDQYQALGHDNEDRYEFVDGLLVSLPPMADNEHGGLIDNLKSLMDFLPDSYGEHPVRAYTALGLRLGLSSRGGETSHKASSSKSHRSYSSRSDSSNAQSGKARYPDLFVVNRSEGSDASNATVSTYKGSRECDWKKAILVMEVTSTNRNKDLKLRREEYEEEQIPEYVVLDRKKNLKTGKSCVQVYKLGRTGKYAMKEYTDNQKVDCSFFKYWHLSAKQMLDLRSIRTIWATEKKMREQDKARADRAEAGRHQAEAERDQQKKRADRAEAERDQHKKRADQAEADRQHAIAYIKGKRSTPPRALTLGSDHLKSPNSHASSKSLASPKSPASPPYRVRRTSQSHVNITASKGKRRNENESKKQ